MTYRSVLLSGVALLFPGASLLAQQPPSSTTAPPPSAAATSASADDLGDEEDIVITGQRARGSVVGDIPPQNILDARDVRATGATSITELLEALAPQIGSARGRGAEAPVLLLNGLRISGFRELRDIPTEAIQRVEILPEEVALKYGYRADQKVVNIVLRQRFRSTTVQLAAGGATDGGYASGSADLTRFLVQRDGRTTLNLHAEGNSLLTEAERDIALSQPPSAGTTEQALAARSLLGSKRDVRASGTFNRQIFKDVSTTINTEVDHSEGRSLIGLNSVSLEPLPRHNWSDSAHLGLSLNGTTRSQWRWTLTSNADVDGNVTRTDRDDPRFPSEHSRSTTASADVKGTANGKLFKLPAGDATTTLTLGGSTIHLDSSRSRVGATSSNSPGRTSGEAAVNLDLPISRKNRDFSALGNLTLNANAEVDQLSDFGTLTIVGAGANWSPLGRLNLLASWTREEGAPTINQLGDPILDTPSSRIFDFTTGQTVLVDAITGGNPNLRSDVRHVWKLGGNWQPSAKMDLRLRAEFVHQTTNLPIGNISVTPAIEAAFPSRFVRGACTPQPDCIGPLIAVDLRPLNYDSAQRDALRIGFDFSKPLKSRRPSQSTIDQIRAQFRQAFGGAAAGPGGSTASPPVGPPPEGGPPAEGGRGGFGGFGGGGRGGGGGFFGGPGGGSRGRLTFSLTDAITFADKVLIAPGGPELDYLHGDAASSSGGTPRHRIEAQAGWSNNGLGARIGANWRSGTTVSSLTGDDLRFSSLGTVDLRLFANPGDVPEVALKHPWLRGTQFRLEVNNLFNSRPQVRDAAGAVPLNYQPALLDPLGRTIMFSFRKLFLPSPATIRRMFQQERTAGTPKR